MKETNINKIKENLRLLFEAKGIEVSEDFLNQQAKVKSDRNSFENQLYSFGQSGGRNPNFIITIDTRLTTNSNTSASDSFRFDAITRPIEVKAFTDKGAFVKKVVLSSSNRIIQFDTPGVYRLYIQSVDRSLTNSIRISLRNTTNPADIDKLISVDNWGRIKWSSLRDMFRNSPNLLIKTKDNPDLTSCSTIRSCFNGTQFDPETSLSGWDTSNISDMSFTFAGSNFNGSLSNWDTSNVTTMDNMFAQTTDIDANINNWDVSNVTTMVGMFRESTFNQPLNNWKTSSLVNMSFMFFDNKSFNQNINTWNVSNVTNMAGVFNGGVFNQPLNNWNTSSVTTMSQTFYQNSQFNQPIDNWDTSSVTNLEFMFASYNGTPTVFNQPIDNWDVSNVETFEQMFGGDTSFNQPLNSWDTSSATNMQGLFFDSDVFNQPLDNWNTSNVTNMVFMFSSTSVFNQDLSSWCVELIPSEPADFATDAPQFTEPKPNWGAPCIV